MEAYAMSSHLVTHTIFDTVSLKSLDFLCLWRLMNRPFLRRFCRISPKRT